jgi:tetratricopeptide (TPR) repeat protein
LLERPPLGGELYYVLGKAYFHRGRFYTDSAIRALERSLELEYRAEDSFEYLGLAYSRLGLFDEAVEYFLRSAEENPSDILFLTVAQTYYEDGRLEPALEYAERAIERTDDDFLAERARFLIGEVYLDLESYGDAERFFQSILENNPRSAQAHVLLGEIYSRRGDDVRARDAWREALRLDPNNVEAWERLN